MLEMTRPGRCDRGDSHRGAGSYAASSRRVRRTCLSPGFAYGIPPILNFGSDALKEKFLPDLLTGRARTCIAITEPQAGSDVAGIQTTAVKSRDGTEYVINGEKVSVFWRVYHDFDPSCFLSGSQGKLQ